MPIYARFAQDMGSDESGAGLIIATPSVARGVLNLFVGRMCDKHGRKPLLVGGTAIMAVGAYGTAGATSLSTCLAYRLLVGCGGAASDISAQALAQDIVSTFPWRRGFLLGWYNALTTLAYAGGPVVGSTLAARGDARTPFYLLAYALALCAPVYALLPESKRARSKHDSDAGLVPDASATPSASDATMSLSSKGLETYGLARASDGASAVRALLSDSRQQALLLLRFSLVTGWSAWLAVLPTYLSRTFSLATASIGSYLSLLTLLGFACSGCSGTLSDRYGRFGISWAGALAQACSLGLVPAFKSQPWCWTMLALWESGSSAMSAATSAAAADVTPFDLRGAQSSLSSQVQDGTFALMPSTLGLLSAHVGIEAVLILTATVQLIAIRAAAQLLRQPHGQRTMQMHR